MYPNCHGHVAHAARCDRTFGELIGDYEPKVVLTAAADPRRRRVVELLREKPRLLVPAPDNTLLMRLVPTLPTASKPMTHGC